MSTQAEDATLRDMFAAHALTGLLASGKHHARPDSDGIKASVFDAHAVTRDAYALADEMIEARNEGKAP
jgi:hypothetical protein